MSIDRDPMCSRMIRVSDEVHDMLCQAKLIPQEPYNNCLKRIIAENNYLKRHYVTEAPRESMYRDLKNFVLNPAIPEIATLVHDGHRAVWNAIHPDDPIIQGEVIHHINGDHDDNTPSNLLKINQSDHGKYHKQLDNENSVNKTEPTKKEITFDIPKKIL